VSTIILNDQTSPSLFHILKNFATQLFLHSFFAFVFVCFLSLAFINISDTNPKRLQNGVDWEGNFCGVPNEVNKSLTRLKPIFILELIIILPQRRDLSDRQYLIIADPNKPKLTSICSRDCPQTNGTLNPNDTNSYVCHYKYEHALPSEKFAQLGNLCWFTYEVCINFKPPPRKKK
jgi:hypothetical protein